MTSIKHIQSGGQLGGKTWQGSLNPQTDRLISNLTESGMMNSNPETEEEDGDMK